MLFEKRFVTEQTGIIPKIVITTIIVFFFFLSCNNLFAAKVKITFDPSKDSRVVGHKIYYGMSTHISNIIDIGKKNSYIVYNLQKGVTYYFAATAYDKYGNESGFSNIMSYDVPGINSTIPRNNWNLLYVNSEEFVGEDGRGENAFDGHSASIWHTEWYNRAPSHPHEIQIDLGATYELESFRYLPRQDGYSNGRIKDYVVFVSNDPVDWGSAVASGTFANSASEKTVLFNSPAVGQFIRLVALSEVNDRPFTSIAELNVVGTFLY